MSASFLKILFGFAFVVGIIPQSYGEDNLNVKMDHHHMHHGMEDGRVSLQMPEKMKQHQLANMRSHLEAVQEIVGLIGKKEFQHASLIAHKKLGLTDDMKDMCSAFGNKDFENLGLSFHKSADTLGDVLLTKNVDKSLEALNTTLGYCTQCHATFKQ